MLYIEMTFALVAVAGVVQGSVGDFAPASPHLPLLDRGQALRGLSTNESEVFADAGLVARLIFD